MRHFRVLLASSLISTTALARNYCTASQKCWPSSEVWSNFNASIYGRLLAPRPPAWPCHDPNYDETACADAKSNWNVSFWRSSQPGAMQSVIWESLGCGINTPRNQTCEQGFVPTYSVAAQEASDISKAVKFAAKHKIKLVVKNTGHDYLGRASGKGSLSIWMRQLKGINFTDSFVADGCKKESGVPSIKLGAAEQWRDVYKAADEHNVTVAGGASNRVGAAGGWLQGGGHGPLGSLYGMGVENVLQFTVVKANGEVVKANACQNKDLFWALRGGGPGTYGIVLDVAYRTHPPLASIVGLAFSANVTSSQRLTELTDVFFRSLPRITDQGVRGYAFWLAPVSFAFIAIHPNSPNVASTNETLQPLYDWVSNNTDTQVVTAGSVHQTFFDWFTNWIQDIGIASPVWLGGRLVSRSALEQNTTALANLAAQPPDYIANTINIVGGGAIDTVDPNSTGLNPQWRKSALISWNLSTGWTGDTPEDLVNQFKAGLTNFTQELGKVAGLSHAAYLNEADPEESQWKKAFFGSHYSRLLKIKRQLDPKGVFSCNRCVGSDS